MNYAWVTACVPHEYHNLYAKANSFTRIQVIPSTSSTPLLYFYTAYDYQPDQTITG